MEIGQAIYTHTKVRRDTLSTGFGFYSMTPDMERLLAENRALAAAASNYIAPRNFELWWDSGEQDIIKRGKTEAQRIKEYHPVSFAYRLFDTDDGEIAALTFGRNLGRDLSPLTRDGNILVNTLTADPEQLDCYPYEYYGSTALFLDCERDFFLNAGDGPAPDLRSPGSIPRGKDAPGEDEIAQFLAEEDRLPVLCQMLDALMKINDGGSKLRRVMICDRRENMILWIGALSLVFPKKTARALTFSTYSFLGGNPDDLSPVYDDVMICGVYTPTVNGSPDSKHATNYDPAREQNNPETALFDFEQGIFPEEDGGHPYFSMFIESAFGTDLRLLDSYREFIAEKTSCRTPDSSYARGYGYFTISRLKNEYSLRFIGDAAGFAGKYMTPQALEELFETAFSCGFVSENAEDMLAGVLTAAGNAADGGALSAEKLSEFAADCLLRRFRDEDTQRETYAALKKQLSEFLAKRGISLEKTMLGRMSDEELEGYCTAACKRWRLAELAGMISRQLKRSGEVSFTDGGRLTRTLLRLSRRLVISEKNDRGGLMDALLGAFSGETAAKYFCAVFRLFGDKPEIRRELAGTAGSLMPGVSEETLAELIRLAEGEGVLDETLDRVTEQAAGKLPPKECAALFSRLIKAGGERVSGRAGDFMQALRASLGDGENALAPESIYTLWEFAHGAGYPGGTDAAALIREYFDAAAAVSGRYAIDEETGEPLLRMTAAAPDPQAVLSEDPELASAEAMIFARVFAEEPDTGNMYPEPGLLPVIDFAGMTEAERYECVREAGNAFCRRSIKLGSALDVAYGYFIDAADKQNERTAADIFAAWADELAVIRPPECLKLIGQTIAMSSPFMRGGLLIGNMLYERGITPDEVKPCVFDRECLKFIGTAPALTRLEKLMDEITDIYESRAVVSPFGKIRSKLGSKKQKR